MAEALQAYSSDSMGMTPFLAENQPAKQREVNRDYQPTEEEQKALDLVKNLFYKCKRHRSLYDSKFVDDYQFFRGKQWDKTRPSYKHSEVLNFVFQAIQSQVPLLTDASPRFEFIPQNPKNQEVCDILNDVAQADWENNNWKMQLFDVILDGHIYSLGHSYMGWDPKANHGAGNIHYSSEETFYIYPDPEARDVNDKCGYFHYLEPRDVDKLKLENPEKAPFIKPDLGDFLILQKNDMEPIRYKSPTDNKTILEGGGGIENFAGRNMCLVIHTYIKDQVSTVTDESTDPETGEIVYTERLKYPNGRYIKIAGGVVLKDEPMGYDHGQIPFQRFVNYILPREYWGMSEIEQVRGTQRVINRIYSFILDVLALQGAPIWIVDSTSGVETENLVCRTGMVIEKEPNSEVRMEPGVQLQPWIMQLLKQVQDMFDRIAGTQDITRGDSTGGVTAASAIDALLSTAQTRIRQKAQNLDIYLTALGNQYKSLVFQFYTTSRVFRLTGKDGSQKYFRMHVVNADDQGNPLPNKLMKVQFINPDGTEGNVNTYEITAEIDVRSTMGSSLPFNKEAKKRDSLDLFDRGIIDGEEVLKNIDYPNREVVLQRMKAQQQAQAQAQQGQAGKQKAG